MNSSRSSIWLHSFQGTFALLAKGPVCNPCLRNELSPISQEGHRSPGFYFPVGENRRHSPRVTLADPSLWSVIFRISVRAGRVLVAGLWSPFFNFPFGGAETGSIADRDRFAGDPWGVRRTNASNATRASFLVSAIQISSNARLALACWLFGNLVRTLAVLCTQQ